jgi:hypothetical protein
MCLWEIRSGDDVVPVLRRSLVGMVGDLKKISVFWCGEYSWRDGTGSQPIQVWRVLLFLRITVRNLLYGCG